ncbi:hydrogenase subunit MbhD domain-containing protein [Alishewanella longhuensis]
MGLVLFDLVLATVLILLSAAAIFSRNLTHAVMLFMAFGVTMALAWARLAAPDLALAEAAIGAGLTGALCFTALARQPAPLQYKATSARVPAAFIALSTAALLFSVWQIPSTATETLANEVAAALPQSGVAHPVTAVLLNFRAWDTFLELLVLLLALLGARQTQSSLALKTGWSLSLSWSRILSPVLILLTGYLLWRGAAAPGGAFQAGALLASGLVVLRLNQQLNWLSWQNVWVRLIALSGLFVFMLTGIFSLFLSPSQLWLDWPTAYAGGLILLIETFATLAIAITLTLLVVGEPAEVVADA